MEQSILNSTKKVLGIGPDDDSFDYDVISYINSAFSVLHDLGIGPDAGFIIEDDSLEWEDYVSDVIVQSEVRTTVALMVRLVFDPPTTSYHLTALTNQIQEHQWRLNVRREAGAWVDPSPPLVVIDE
jgi:hypothetical protein